MSLKSFHIFFISVATIFAFGFGVWLLIEHPIALEALNVFAALFSFTVGGALVLYAVRFLRKFKHLSFM
jgi:predicted DNA repair protein MutK